MATNLALDDRLIRAAQKAGHHPTKRAAVTQALEEYVGHRRRLRALDLFGSVAFDRGYDYKAQRRRR
jgi:Arc/MetJ family transcription regulator